MTGAGHDPLFARPGLTMIGTHRPRGYIWSCPSLFQQTPLFRNINVADCAAVSRDQHAASDLEDDFSPKVRVAKRRRLERLANDYLNGLDLEINSATMVPLDVRHAVASTYDVTKRGWKALSAFDADGKSEEIAKTGDWWEDVDDPLEILQIFLAGQGDPPKMNSRLPTGNKSKNQDELISNRKPVQANYGDSTHLRPVARVTFGLSDDALQKAARLRERGSWLSRSHSHSCPSSSMPTSQTQQSSFESHETASDCGASPTPAWTSSKWLKSGALNLRRRTVNEDCSRDELGVSSSFTPSQGSRASRKSLAIANTRTNVSATQPFAQMPGVVAAATTTTAHASACSELDATNQHEPSVLVLDAESQPPVMSYLTRQSQTQLPALQNVRNYGTDDLGNHTGPFLDGLERLISTPTLLSIADTAVNPDTKFPHDRSHDEAGYDFEAVDLSVEKPELRRQRVGPLRVPQPRISIQVPTQHISASEVSRDLTAQVMKPPSVKRRHNRSYKKQYSSVVNVNGGLPFKFRKRLAKSKASDGAPENRSCVSPLMRKSSITASMTPAGLPCDSAEIGIALDMSHSLNGSYAPNTKTPLVEKHLNSILPQDHPEDHSISSLRKSLREELRASGAELSRYEGDSRSASDFSPTENCNDTGEDEHHRSSTELEASQSLRAWPGTQVLLAQAHENLFTPQARVTASHVIEKMTTPSQHRGHHGTYQPPHQLSPEPFPLPNTQALLDGWHGWSSIKKRKAVDDPSDITRSPNLGRGPNAAISLHTPFKSREGHRKSSLRLLWSGQDKSRTPRDSLSFGQSVSQHQSAPGSSPQGDDSQECDRIVTELVNEVLVSATSGLESSGF